MRSLQVVEGFLGDLLAGQSRSSYLNSGVWKMPSWFENAAHLPVSFNVSVNQNLVFQVYSQIFNFQVQTRLKFQTSNDFILFGLSRSSSFILQNTQNCKLFARYFLVLQSKDWRARELMMRLMNAFLVLVLRDISEPVRRRFPTYSHLVTHWLLSKASIENSLKLITN